MSRLFHPASARDGVSHSLLCFFCFVFKEGDFQVWHCASCPAGVTAAVLSGGGLLPVAMVIKDLPSQGNAPLLHRCVFPGNWLQQHRHLSLLGSRAAFEYPMGDWSVLTLPDAIGDYRIRVFIFSLKAYSFNIMAYWNTSLLSCGKTGIPGVVCFSCLAGMLSPHLFPHQSTSTTLDFLS